MSARALPLGLLYHLPPRPAHPHSVLIRLLSPSYPRPPTPSYPCTPFVQHNPSGFLWPHSPVSHIVVPCPWPTPTIVPSLTVTPTPPLPSIFCHPDQCRSSAPGPLRILHTPPPPPPNPLPHPFLHLTQTTPPTLTHDFSIWKTQLPHSLTELRPSCTNPSSYICQHYTLSALTSKPYIRTHGTVRLFQHLYSNLSFLTSIVLMSLFSLTHIQITNGSYPYIALLEFSIFTIPTKIPDSH